MLLKGVKIGPSPAWMQERLQAAGVRPINNVVDVTNFVMLEWGQPLHAYDYDRVRGGTLVARRARPGERLLTLAAERPELELSPEQLVIADAERAVGLAGVIGGADTEVTEGTTAVLLEAANFLPVSHPAHGAGLPRPADRGVAPLRAGHPPRAHRPGGAAGRPADRRAGRGGDGRRPGGRLPAAPRAGP